MFVRKGELPAILASTEVTLAAATSAALPAFAPLWRTSFIHHQCAAHQSASIASLHRLCCRGIVVDLNESKTSCFTAEPVTQNVDAIHVNASLFKKSLKICLCSLVGQVPYEKLCH